MPPKNCKRKIQTRQTLVNNLWIAKNIALHWRQTTLLHLVQQTPQKSLGILPGTSIGLKRNSPSRKRRNNKPIRQTQSPILDIGLHSELCRRIFARFCHLPD